MKEVNVQTEEERDSIDKIKRDIELLRAENLALKATVGKGEGKKEEEYRKENLKISVTGQHDSESEEEADETTQLRTEVQALRAKVKDLE